MFYNKFHIKMIYIDYLYIFVCNRLHFIQSIVKLNQNYQS